MEHAVQLRLLQPDDAEAIARHLDDPEMFRNLRDYIPNPYSLQDAEEFIKRSLQADHELVRVIEVKDQLTGIISVRQQKDVYRKTAEIGYWLGKEYWGQGIMSQAVIKMTALAFEQMDIVKVFASTFATNPASQRVLEKADYTREAILKKAVYKNGEVIDSCMYACFKASFNRGNA